MTSLLVAAGTVAHPGQDMAVYALDHLVAHLAVGGMGAAEAAAAG